MNLLGFLVFVSLQVALLSAKCTRPPPASTENPPPTTTTPPLEDTTTVDYPPPESWPKGLASLMMAGPSCPDFYPFRKGSIYQDTEDYYNGNDWPTESRGMQGPMKHDGYRFHFCTKNKWYGDYHWPAGDYCFNQGGGKCPPNFQKGNITWDDEDDYNQNTKSGRAPTGVYGEDTTLLYCCRNDGPASAPIDLPVTVPFYLLRYTDECQRVRRMTVTEEVVQWDDNDSPNRNSKLGAHPMDDGNPSNHRLHFCLYEPLY